MLEGSEVQQIGKDWSNRKVVFAMIPESKNEARLRRERQSSLVQIQPHPPHVATTPRDLPTRWNQCSSTGPLVDAIIGSPI
mmetsp:Transcript_4299/g.12279  ORF Transcript_4299/g.12279 Transcript_4299/m.12279 type:complete len:81 (+) Transcript_4299:611-853(+)